MSMAVLSAAIGLVRRKSNLLVIVVIAFQWWRDVIREAQGGYHTWIVQRGLLLGFLLF